MANGTLGTLTIDVLANIAGMVSDMQKAQDVSAQAAKQFQRDWQDATSGISDGIKTLAATLGVAFSADQFKELISATVEMDVTVAHLTDTLGIATGTLSDLNAAATISGGGIDDATQAITRMERAQAQAEGGSQKFVSAFDALGISMAQLKQMSPDELLQTVAERLDAIAPSANKTALEVALFGRNIAAINPMLEALANGAHDLSVSLGAAITPAATAAAEAYEKSMGEVKLSVQGLAQSFIAQFLPALSSAAQQFAIWLSSSEGVHTALSAVGETLDFVVSHLDLLGTAIGVVVAYQLDVKIAAWAESVYGMALQTEGATSAMYALGSAAVAAVGIGVAAFAGWQIGTWARENFAWVAELGQWIAAAATTIQTAMQAPFDAAIGFIKTAVNAFVAWLRETIAAAFEGIAQTMAASFNPIMQQMGASFEQLANSIKPAQSAAQVWSQGITQVGTDAKNAIASVDDLWKSIFQDSGAAGAKVDAMNAFRDALKQTTDAMSQGKLTAAQATQALEHLDDAAIAAAHAGNDSDVIWQQVTAVQAMLAVSTQHVSDKTTDFTGQADLAGQAAKKLSEEMAKWSEENDVLQGKLGGPIDQALKTFDDDMLKAAETLVVMMGNGLSAADAMQMLAERTDLETQKMWASIAADNQKNDVLATLQQKQIDQLASLEAVTTAQKAQVEVQQLVNATQLANNTLLDNFHDLEGNIYPTIQQANDAIAQQAAGLTTDTTAWLDHMQQVKLDQEAMKEWASVASNAFDSAFSAINKDIIEGGSVMKDLVKVAQQVVEAILMQFEKLAIINPLLNQIFGASAGGAGGGLLPTLENSAIGQLFGSGGGIGSLFSGNGMFSGIGNTIESWFGGGVDTASQSVGVYAGLDQGANAVTDTAFTTDWGAAANDITDGITAGAPDIGATIGTSAGSSFFGTVAPMLGAFFAGDQIAGPAGGIALAAAAYFVPIVGWIAGAASLVNSLTGGGLFGTDWKPTGNTAENLSFSSSGATIDETAEESKKKALFGGHEWKLEDIPVDPKTTAALTQFTTTLQTQLDKFDALFGQTGAQIASGTYSAQFDKTGKMTSSTETIGGQTITGETDQQFQEREQAQSMIDLMDKLGLGATAFVSGLQGDADKLLAGVTDMANTAAEAQQNLGAGFKFMGLSATQTLPEVMKFVEGLQQSGETLQQTYTRLIQAQAAYDQFVGQFKPATTYVDPFEQSIAQLYAQMGQSIDQANALAKAAGAAGASTQDLVNIQQTYAAQMAQLTVQLENSAQQLAFSLGLTETGSLDQVTQEINALEGQAGSASSSVQSFGGAMTSAAQAASAATNLLLGNLSPLNDQQKLQVALQGLREGTVTADQVLQIGRSLYASSEAYNQLFAEVEPYANAATSHGGGTVYNGSEALSGSSTSGLSDADQKKLKDLLAEQAQLQQAALTQQYQQLAQEIAEIATAKGEDFTQVMKDMGISSADLEKALGLKDDAALATYMSTIQSQTDSQGNNTQSIVTAIQNLPYELANLLQGKSFGGGPVIGGVQTRTAPDGTGTSVTVGPPATGSGGPTRGPGSGTQLPPGRTMTDADAKAIGQAVGTYGVRPHLAPIQANYPRSSRIPANVR